MLNVKGRQAFLKEMFPVGQYDQMIVSDREVLRSGCFAVYRIMGGRNGSNIRTVFPEILLGWLHAGFL